MDEIAVHDEMEWTHPWEDCDPLRGIPPSLACAQAKGIQDISLSVDVMKVFVHIFNRPSLYLPSGGSSFCIQLLS